jgi:hypothetical protein
MKMPLIHLILQLILAFVVTEKTTAFNDPVKDNSAKGILIGLNFGGMVSDLQSATFRQCEKQNVLSSFTFGASYTSCLNNLLDIKLGVQFEKKGIALKETLGSFIFSSGGSHFQLKYLTFHQSVLITTRGRTFVYIGPGIYQAFLLHASSSLYDDPRDDEVYNRTRKFDFGPRLQVGIGMEVIPRLRAHIEITGATGTKSVHNDKHIFSIHSINRSVSGTAGLTYNF